MATYRNLIWASVLTWASPCDANFAAGGFEGGGGGGGGAGWNKLHKGKIDQEFLKRGGGYF